MKGQTYSSPQLHRQPPNATGGPPQAGDFTESQALPPRVSQMPGESTGTSGKAAPSVRSLGGAESLDMARTPPTPVSSKLVGS